MKIGITGHQQLPRASDWKWTKRQLVEIIMSAARPLVGISSLAVGADQLFADIILQEGGTLEAIIPFEDYERTFTTETDKDEYRRILSRASHVEVLERVASDEENYLKAGKRVADKSDLLIAVWDGKPAAGLGGTGDIVEYTLTKKKVVHLNPIARSKQSR